MNRYWIILLVAVIGLAVSGLDSDLLAQTARIPPP